MSAARRLGLPSVSLLALLMTASGVEAQRTFTHDSHRSLQCTDCHANGQATSSTNRAWCAGCHHVDVAVTQCSRCHDPDDLLREPRRVLVTFHLPAAVKRVRSLSFDHAPHDDLGCGSCHSGGAALSVERDCAGCHVEHHEAGSRCTACHAEPPVTAHAEEVHLDLASCGEAGCHVSEGLDYAAMVDSRMLCVSCHVGQDDHEPGDACAACHILQPQRSAGRPPRGVERPPR